MISPYNISVYKVTKEGENLNEKGFEILNINLADEIQKSEIKGEKLNLYKINIKEKMPVIFYTNIMFYDNLNKTLPLGMDVQTKTLIELQNYNLKPISQKEFYTNIIKSDYENQIKQIKVYEYDLTIQGN